jgi:AI-2 transport protein TqsA
VLILLALIFAALALIVAFTISDIVDNADHYKERAKSLMDTLVEIAEDYGYTRADVEAMMPDIDLASYAVSAGSYLANIVTQMVLVMLIVVYMLLGYDGSNKSVLQSAIDTRIRKYIMIHSAISVATGAMTSVILLIFGVDLVLFLGLMACILNYIPNIGSVLGVLLPLPFVLFKEDFAIWELLAVAVALTLMQFLLGQVLEPKILGNAMDMPPITVICVLLFWGAIWGIIGAILSVPLTVAIQLYLENIDHPAAKALAGMIVGDFHMFDSSKRRDAVEDPKKKDLELAVLSDDVAAVATHTDDYHEARRYDAYEAPRGRADYRGGDDYYRGGGAGYDDQSYAGGDYQEPEPRQPRRSKP